MTAILAALTVVALGCGDESYITVNNPADTTVATPPAAPVRDTLYWICFKVKHGHHRRVECLDPTLTPPRGDFPWND